MINRVTRPKTRFNRPRFADTSWSASAAPSSPLAHPPDGLEGAQQDTRFTMPMQYRNSPETVVPKSPRKEWSSAVPAARPVGQAPDSGRQQGAHAEHDARVAQGKPESHGHPSLALAAEFPRDVVDRRNMVGVESMAQAERVGRYAEADAEGAGRRRRGSFPVPPLLPARPSRGGAAARRTRPCRRSMPTPGPVRTLRGPPAAGRCRAASGCFMVPASDSTCRCNDFDCG